MNTSESGSQAAPTDQPAHKTSHPLIQQLILASPLPANRSDPLPSLLPIPEAFQDALGTTVDLSVDSFWNSPLFHWLLAYFREHPLHLAPVDQVQRVHQLTPVLFDCFQLKRGVLQLGGCNLSDRPLLRLTQATADYQLQHHYFDLLGNPLDRILIKDLGLGDLQPFRQSHVRPPMMTLDQLASWRRFMEQTPEPTDVSQKAVFVAVVWCKHAAGELVASGEADRLRLPFEGWAAQLLSGAVKPPPYREPTTGDTSYELVRLDDGTLTAATAAGLCSVSGKRALRNELSACAVTGKRALRELLVACPVTGDLVLDEALATCEQCRQSVGTHCLDEQQVCLACRNLKPAGAEDPRLARTLGEYPGLGVWRRWRMAETKQAYILTASAVFRQLILVLDSDSLAPLHVATRSRFTRHWVSPSKLEQQELLRG